MFDQDNNVRASDVGSRYGNDFSELFREMSKIDPVFNFHTISLRTSVTEFNRDALYASVCGLTRIIENRLPKGLPERDAWCDTVPLWAELGDCDYFYKRFVIEYKGFE